MIATILATCAFQLSLLGAGSALLFAVALGWGLGGSRSVGQHTRELDE